MDAAGAWAQTSARQRSYSSSVDPNLTAMTHGHGLGAKGEVCMTHYAPGQAALVPPEKIQSMVLPTVLELADETTLDIIAALKYVEKRQVCYFCCKGTRTW